MFIYLEIFLTQQTFDVTTFKNFLKKCNSFSVYWYSLINEGSLFFVRMKIETNKFDDRICLMYELIDIFEHVKIIACGYKNYWNVVLLNEGIVHYPRVYRFLNVTENSTLTFLSLHMISLLDHELWIEMFCPFKRNFVTNWQMYHWLCWTDIEKFFQGTIKHTNKSYVNMPFRLKLGEIFNFKIYTEFPFEIEFQTMEVFFRKMRISSEDKDISHKIIKCPRSSKSKIPVLISRPKSSHLCV